MTLLHTRENIREDISFTLERKNVLLVSDKDLYILYGIIIIQVVICMKVFSLIFSNFVIPILPLVDAGQGKLH